MINMVVEVVEVVTDTRHYHNCESQQPAITGGESGSMLSTAGYKVVTTIPGPSQSTSDQFITINASPSYNVVIANLSFRKE